VRFALVSNILPPGDSSHAAVIHRLLRDLDSRHYCLVSSGSGGESSTDPGRLAGTRYDLPPVPRLTRGYRLGLRLWRERVNFAWRDRQGEGHRPDSAPGAVRCRSCTGGHEILDFPAAFLASRHRGATPPARSMPGTWSCTGKRIFARLEPMLLKRATAVIFANEFRATSAARSPGRGPASTIRDLANMTARPRTGRETTRADRLYGRGRAAAEEPFRTCWRPGAARTPGTSGCIGTGNP
jgi:hypothetical protein